MTRARTPPVYAYDWTTTRLYELDSLWWGCSIGGKHYTGHVSWHPPGTDDYPRHEIERKLSLKEAKALDPDAGERYWISGIQRETNRFDTLAQLERAATKWVEGHAKGVPNWLLIKSGGDLNPARPIAAQGWFKPRMETMTTLAQVWDKVPDHVRMSKHPAAKRVWRVTYKAWYDLLTPP